jgi:hypothetical protein
VGNYNIHAHYVVYSHKVFFLGSFLFVTSFERYKVARCTALLKGV